MLEVDIGQILHLSDIVLPEGVTSPALSLGEDHDLAVASVVATKGIKLDTEATEQEEGSDSVMDGSTGLSS